ncbi:2-hydroxychromene-2-carboxylate isomerase [Sphingorhabdus sp. Alg239-R122]|uniref:2-hydroxychromene-2-carboxylate isomerase n=1 Tax=Sphingorhabdus sp. Alg239-R122 TaxID=2305989 RepID=UPI0013DD76D9|nr:2-hydroxychromene-2-carboxylate isomerase [Sphingorhabdus sp. Alg239-R122]
MTKTIEFLFDFGSPTSYLAYKRLLQLADTYDARISYVPILLGGVFKATGNSSPVMVPAKGAYMLKHDMPRFARRYGVEMNGNPFFPINTLALMRGAVAAQDMGCFDAYAAAVFDAIWAGQKNMGDPVVAGEIIAAAGIDAQRLLDLAQSTDMKSKLIENTEVAVKRGVFGAPTMSIGDEFFFGQDRLDFVEEILAAG